MRTHHTAASGGPGESRCWKRLLTPSIGGRLSLALLLVGGPSALHAQRADARAGYGDIRGVVLDTANNLLASAHLQLHRLPRPPRLAITRDGGNFALDSVEAGDYLLSVRALGYKPAEFAITVAPGSTPRYELVLEPLPHELNAVVVEASFGRAGVRMAGFIGRMRSGRGRYVTSEQLEKMRPNLLSDALQTIPGLAFSPSWSNGNYRRAFAKRGGLNGARCPMNLYIDGSLLPDGWAVDDVAPIPEIAGIEIYDDWMSAPPQFVPNSYDLRCGAIVIWTKRSRAWS